MSLFNKDLHISIDEVAEFKALEHELERRNEYTYRELSERSLNEEELNRLLIGDIRELGSEKVNMEDITKLSTS